MESRFFQIKYSLIVFQNKPLLSFLLTQIVPCSLHATMAITRLLMKMLVEDSKDCPELERKLRELLEGPEIKLKLPKKNKKEMTLEEQIDKARFHRPEYLKVIEKQDILLSAYDTNSKKSKEQIQEVIT